MKTLKLVLLALAIIVTGASCQKEESVESGLPASVSTGSLKYPLGSSNCIGNTVNGIYTATAALGASNTIDIQVDVITPGNYTIKSNTINGYYFKATGIFSNIGIQTVTLQGTGAPLVPETDIFNISYDGTQCDAAVTVLPAGSAGTSVFTLGGSGSTCTGFVLQGNYIQGTPLNPTNNTATISVDVTTTGTYFIQTNIVNGISFSASGTFILTGPQTVQLIGHGTPTNNGLVDIVVTSGSNTCDFSVDIMQPVVNAVYSLSGTAGACSNALVSGNYVSGTALGLSNIVSLDVNVTTAGSWTVNTAAVNGMSFSGSGIFTTTGPQSITLTGSGTPTTLGANTIPVNAGLSTCSFTITVTSTPTAPCNPATNTADLSGVTTMTFSAVNGSASGGSYTIIGNGPNGDVTLEFAGAVQPTSGLYNIQPLGGSFVTGDVRASFVASSILWNASTGLVYVTVTAGKVTAVICSEHFTGDLGGTPFTSTVSAKITEL